MKFRETLSFVLGLVGVIFLAGILSHSIFGIRFDNIFRDRVRDVQKNNTVVVVGVDDNSLRQIGAWPWKRDVFAKEIEQLYRRGARLVVFDILFLEPREGDEQVKQVLSTLKYPVIFASKLTAERDLISHVYHDTYNAHSALANVYPDEDGKVRSTYFFNKDKNGNCHPTLSRQAFLEYTKSNTNPSCDDEKKVFLYQDNKPRLLSFIDVFNQATNERDLEGTVVFIGSTSLDLDDVFISSTGEKIPGVYIHADMFSQMMHGSFPKALSNIWVIVLILVSVMYVVYVSSRSIKAIYQYAFLSFGLVVLVSIGFFMSMFLLFIPFSFIIFSYIASSVYSLMFRYGVIEKRSRHIRGLFSKYVHEHVLEELLKQPDIVLGGEKRHMSILFSDLRGFTTLSESLDPVELTTLLNAYFSAMSPEILEEKGTIDKFIGDAIMAFWNAPLLVPEYCTHAVRSAMRMEKALEIFNTEHKTSLAAGIGIHAGDVIVGNVGGKDRVNYTVLGDTVNLASRVEGLTKKYGVGVIVTGEVKENTHDHSFLFRKLDVITVKGKTKPTPLYEVRHNTKENKIIFEEYERAFEAYSLQDFNTALVLFHTLGDKGDTPSVVMIERIKTRDVSRPFDGVWHFDEK